MLVVDDAELGPLRRCQPFVGLLLPEVPDHRGVSPARVVETPVDHDLPGTHHGLRRRPWIVLRLDRNRWPDILRLQYRGTARTPRGDGERRGEGDQARRALDGSHRVNLVNRVDALTVTAGGLGVPHRADTSG